MKNKIMYFLALVVVILAILFFGSGIALVANASNFDCLNYMSEKFGDISFLFAIFLEVFSSIILFKFISELISRTFFIDKYRNIFLILFGVRIGILLFVNFVTTYIAILDIFVTMVIGLLLAVFYVVNGMENTKSNIVLGTDNEDLKFINYECFSKLSEVGIDDIEVLKKMLVMKYSDINAAFCTKNREKLKALCSNDVYLSYKTKWEMYDKCGLSAKIENIEYVGVDLSYVRKYCDNIRVKLHLKYTCNEYVVDKHNNVTSGSCDECKFFNKMLIFEKKQDNKTITKCYNCGANVRSDVEECEYCKTQLNFKLGEWILQSDHTIYEGKKR